MEEGSNDNNSNDNSLYISILYGLINASIVLPVLMSFSSIIYRHPAFAPYMPVLVKLTVFSGIVHQVCFSTFSSLPFAVGQVRSFAIKKIVAVGRPYLSLIYVVSQHTTRPTIHTNRYKTPDLFSCRA